LLVEVLVFGLLIVIGFFDDLDGGCTLGSMLGCMLGSMLGCTLGSTLGGGKVAGGIDALIAIASS